MTPAQLIYGAIAVLASTALSMWCGYRLGVAGERLRVTRGLADLEARQALRQGAEAHARATCLGKARLRVVGRDS